MTGCGLQDWGLIPGRTTSFTMATGSSSHGDKAAGVWCCPLRSLPVCYIPPPRAWGFSDTKLRFVLEIYQVRTSVGLVRFSSVSSGEHQASILKSHDYQLLNTYLLVTYHYVWNSFNGRCYSGLKFPTQEFPLRKILHGKARIHYKLNDLY
jgi:hypothetical protein